MPDDRHRSPCTIDNCGHLRQLDAIVDLLGMHRGGISVLDELRTRKIDSDIEMSRLSLLVDELTAQRDAFGQKAHQLQQRVMELEASGGKPETGVPVERVVSFNEDTLTKYETISKLWPVTMLTIFVKRLTGAQAQWVVQGHPQSGADLYAAIRAIHGFHEEAEYELTFRDSKLRTNRGVGRITLPSTLDERPMPASAMNRVERQRVVIEWVRVTFGAEAATDLGERATRLLEEATELGQADGLSREQALAVVEHVYKKRPGDGAKEAGGVGVTLLAYCAARGISADVEEAREIDRILAMDRDLMRLRHNAKVDAGIGLQLVDEE